MKLPGTASHAESPSRRSATPPGYRNVRVLVPVDMHWRLSSFASQSQMSLPAFVLATLRNAIPLEFPIEVPRSLPGMGDNSTPPLRQPPETAEGQVPSRSTPDGDYPGVRPSSESVSRNPDASHALPGPSKVPAPGDALDG